MTEQKKLNGVEEQLTENQRAVQASVTETTESTDNRGLHEKIWLEIGYANLATARECTVPVWTAK